MATHVDTKSQIVNSALQLFQTRGFNGFSYQDISKPLGIKNAAIHYHFPTKADLGVAIIDYFRDVLHKFSDQFMQEGGDAVSQLEGYLNYTRNFHTECAKVCPIVMAAADYEVLPDEVRAQAKLLTEETLAWLTRVLEVGRDQGSFHFDADPGARAIVLASSIGGALQLSRLKGMEVIDKVINQIRHDLAMKE